MVKSWSKRWMAGVGFRGDGQFGRRFFVENLTFSLYYFVKVYLESYTNSRAHFRWEAVGARSVFLSVRKHSKGAKE